MILLTVEGKGYGCFAIRKIGNVAGNFVVSASYCHPADRHLFMKSAAREVAVQMMDNPRVKRLRQLGKVGQVPKVFVTVEQDEKGNFDNTKIVEQALKQNLFMPAWARKAYNKKLFYCGLRNDRLTWVQSVKECPGAVETVLADLFNRNKSWFPFA